jgi:hypothetical protein
VFADRSRYSLVFADRSVCAYDPFNTMKDRDFHLVKPFLQQMICMGFHCPESKV